MAPRIRTAIKFLAGLFIGIAIGGLAGGGWLVRDLWMSLPPVDHLADYEPALPLRIHARDGTLLAEYGQERREFVPIERIPLRMRQALLAIEDARYYEHGAVDFSGLARAAIGNVLAGGHAQGGSTITMQVARVFFLSREKTYSRKIKEILLAYKLESVYSKDKILELYMNQIYLGERAYGFAAAASVYFDKTLDELTVAEAAMLAGLPKAPSAYNPIANRERATIRQQYILQRMYELGYIDAQAYQQARTEELVLRTRFKSIVPAAAHAVELVRQLVLKQYGDDAYSLGLDVTTTISMPAQQAAAEALRAGLVGAQEKGAYAGPEGRVTPVPAKDDRTAIRKALSDYPDSGKLRAALVLSASGSTGITAALRDGTVVRIPRKSLEPSEVAALRPDAPKRTRIAPGAIIRLTQDDETWRLRELPQMEGALVSLDVQTGEILALAGGFDFALNKFDHATQAVRQPGSTFKPFVFSAALEKGYFPGTLVDDSRRVVTPAARGQKAWLPRNYGGNYEGMISARRGMVRSKNMVAVNLMEAAGPGYVQQFSERFGFVSELNPPGLPLALGSGAITPLQLTQAYAVFANEGVLTQPRLITRVSERDGDVLYDAGAAPPPQFRVISERNAYVMDSMLRDVVQHGTARGAAKVGRADLAGKTGTSNEARDVWFAGYSSGIASVVWMGYDQPRSLGASTGGTLALPVWTQYMQAAVVGRPESLRTVPEDLAMYEGDYIYPEYLLAPCIEDTNAFVEGLFECRPAVGRDLLDFFMGL